MTLRHVQQYTDQHGKVRRYFRQPGRKKVPLPGEPGSAEFMAAYQAAMAGTPKREIGKSKSAPGTVAAAIAGYYQHNSFTSLAPGTQKMRRAILERFRASKGEKRIAKLESGHLAKMLGGLKPFAARNWLKALRGLMAYAAAIDLIADDPTERIKLTKARPGTFHTWTEDEIEIFERHHAVGTRARLAMALLLYTAARRGDAILLGPQHIREGRLLYRQQKTSRSLAIPVHGALAEIIAASPSHQLTFLVTVYGKPFSAAGFGNWFRRMCSGAGLPQCSAHGLRKAQARRLAEAGCTAHEIAAITGHRTLSEVQRYTEAADQVRMADAAMKRKREVR